MIFYILCFGTHTQHINNIISHILHWLSCLETKDREATFKLQI